MTATRMIQKTNGVDTCRLFETVKAVKASPTLAAFKFRIQNKWVDCGENRSTISGFYGCGEEMKHQNEFVMVADEPDVLLGTDRGANPVEYLLHALTACVTSSMVYHAAARGISIDEVESSVEGDIDLRGFLGIDKNVRNGYQGIRMNFRIKSDASPEQLQEIVALGPTFSPVFDSVTKGVPVQVTAEPKA